MATATPKRLTPAPNEEVQKALSQLFLKAESDIINEIARLRSRGLVDYHAVAALERVQEILKQMQSDAFEYVPQLVETQFYVRSPEARKLIEGAMETVEKHRAGYENAAQLTSTQWDVAQVLQNNLMGSINEAAEHVVNHLQSVLIGRAETDIYRRVGLEMVSSAAATGRGLMPQAKTMIEQLQQEGVEAFVDAAGRRWRLSTYATMVMRTTSRQAEVMAVLTADEAHDLYRISKNGTTCKICAPLEGRVYSKSGTHPDYPPLAAAFGKVDPDGGDELTNTWLNIHPNCLHALLPYSEYGRTPEDIEETRRFSSFETNPRSHDPRSQKQIDRYRQKEKGRAKWLADYRQWERYRVTIPDQTPKTFETFQRHKMAGDAKYKGWEAEYRRTNSQLQKEAENAILAEKGKPPIITITDKAIDRVPLVEIEGMTAEQNQFIQAKHKELLRTARDENGGNEVAFVFDERLGLKGRYAGTDDRIEFGIGLYGKDLLVMHNHPRGRSFSYDDAVTFFGVDGVRTLTIVKNNGAVEVIIKKGEIIARDAIAGLERLRIKNVKTETDNEYERIVQKYLERMEGKGLIIWKKSE